MPPNNLSLKQRLAALSLAPSSSHGQNLDRNLLSPRRAKAFFTPPWMKKNESGLAVREEYNELEVVQDVMARMIFQAGVDFETRPMVVMNASAMPDPDEVNYDLLLSRILSYLNLYVEADYTVVFFAAGGRHTPGWNWVWKAYRSLNRKYRKNLKKLYIVHSSFFSKMLFSLAGAIISPKFFRKISYLDTLSELALHVPLTQIDIPPAVYQENLKNESKITIPNIHSSASSSAAFGVPLEDIMGFEGEKGPVPRVVRDCIQYLRESGLNDEGLFRRSPSSQLLRAAQEAYDRGQVVSLEIWEGAGGGPHLAAVLLKKYLRDLPEPVFGEDMYAIIRKCPIPTSDPGDVEAVRYVREVVLPELKPCVYILLSHYLHLMHEVHLRSASNRMDAHNLAVVLSPNLVKGTNPIRDVQMCLIPTGPTPGVPRSPLDSSSPLPSPGPSSPISSGAGAGAGGFAQRYRNPFSPAPPTPIRATSSSSGLLSPAVAAFPNSPRSPNSNTSNFPPNPPSPTFVPSLSTTTTLNTTTTNTNAANTAAITENKTTLGMVIKLCIQRYYEVFDEVLDRTEVGGFGAGVGVYPGDNLGMGMGMYLLPSQIQSQNLNSNRSRDTSVSASVEGSREGSVVVVGSANGVGGGGEGQGPVSLSFGVGAALEPDAQPESEPESKPVSTNGFASASGALGNGLGRMGNGNGNSSGNAGSSPKPKPFQSGTGPGNATGTRSPTGGPVIGGPPRKDSLGVPTYPVHHRRKSSALSGVSDASEASSIDDEMLVMPIGPGSFSFTRHGHKYSQSTPSVPSTPNSPSFAGMQSGTETGGGVGVSGWGSGIAGGSTFRPSKHRTTLSSGSTTSRGSRGAGRSIHTVDVGLSGAPSSYSSFTVKAKAKSMYSIDSGGSVRSRPGSGLGSGSESVFGLGNGLSNGLSTVTKKGSISVGRQGQSGKGVGAGVEAIGITASGFFTAPGSETGTGSGGEDANKDVGTTTSSSGSEATS